LIITPNPEEEESGDRKFINQVMIVIEKNMSNESFNLQEFAKAMNSSKSVLHSRLQNLTQQSPIEFLRTVRLKKAAQLLALNAYNITQVSYMVGFSDSRYFSTCFKKQFGMTPREYIKKYKQEENIEDQLKSI
ncbi:MAG TPA: helix-turn-helix transcriptional regulator, partial [Petrimonas sp.]|nr:helix-turn-helix transcriptional regulator [Petrimonas sp.]